MNARQKAKKFKKEYQRLQDLIDHRIHPVNVVRTNFHPEPIKYKDYFPSYFSDDIIKDEIAKHFGDYLMKHGFIDVLMVDERVDFFDILNKKIVEAYMVTIDPQEYKKFLY